jgi:hypothetical protein
MEMGYAMLSAENFYLPVAVMMEAGHMYRA